MFVEKANIITWHNDHILVIFAPLLKDLGVIIISNLRKYPIKL